MPLIDRKAAISSSMQRWFGLSLGVLLMLLAYSLRHIAWVGGALAVVGLATVALYYALPKTQRPIIRIWQTLTYPLTWIISHILMLGIFFGIVLPIGLLLRLWRVDSLRLTNVQRDTEWVRRPSKRPVSRYFKQF